jgi:regulatory protein YycI of two-component signal transduction system YycFG
MKTNSILLCILIFLILIYLNNTKSVCREGLTVTNPLEYKLTDENITKIYREYCDKFALPGGLELNDARRKLSLTGLINDAKSFVNDPNSVNLCYTTPPIKLAAGDSLTDDLRTKIYGIFCKTPITLTAAQKAMTFYQLWDDAQTKTC